MNRPATVLLAQQIQAEGCVEVPARLYSLAVEHQ
jgi:hypothetical protein